uniref:Uncharacterized protein n=1 Tax=Glossina palpalis gambiensis TaxID=67801 RepID=A0A1B0C1A9_9MUSC
MELRSTRHNSDYEDLAAILEGLGLHEENMELLEMREILSALQQSVDNIGTDDNAAPVIIENERKTIEYFPYNNCFQEGETEFMSKRSDGVFNSTMLKDNSAQSSGSESADNSGVRERIFVQAQVHHSLDWTPDWWNQQEDLQPAQPSTTSPTFDNNSFSIYKDPKQHDAATMQQSETGNEDFHEQRGPVSVRQGDDCQEHSVSTSFSMSGSALSSGNSQVRERHLELSTSSAVVSDQEESTNLNDCDELSI